MPLSLDQYSDFLSTRDLIWPQPPEPVPVKARPHLVKLPEVRGILWTVYGTLVNITEGDLKFWVENELMINVALDKTITEFKMWQSMSRKPGQPAEYMRELYKKAYDEQRLLPSKSEKHPETLAERVWEGLVKKLMLKEYKFDAGFFGSLNEYSKKIAFFFHTSMQGVACYPDAARTLQELRERGLLQGLLADGQCFTPTQLRKGLLQQVNTFDLDVVMPLPYRVLSADCKARKPSETLLSRGLEALAAKGLEPNEILHIGSSIERDIAPAKEYGMKTCLFAGDKTTLIASADQLKDARFRPDLLITALPQLADVLG
jgi:FMN phosphatase YigB (HAD superfamily)